MGLFEYYFAADGSASIGLALRPDRTGRGLGASFLQAGIEFLIARYGYSHPHVYLDVAPTNEPALKLYQRAGSPTSAPASTTGASISTSTTTVVSGALPGIDHDP